MILELLGSPTSIEKQKRLEISNLFVTPEGFEPPTNRTGICHSIQLNYGAIEGAKVINLLVISKMK